jgi:hypothetical protein
MGRMRGGEAETGNDEMTIVMVEEIAVSASVWWWGGRLGRRSGKRLLGPM